MKPLRRIATALFIFSVIAFGLSTITSLTISCFGDSCLASLPLYNQDFSVAYSTTPDLGDSAYNLAMISSVVQSTSKYALFIAVTILIALELRELHYLKHLFRHRRAHAR